MPQTIRVAADAGLTTPTLYLWDVSGNPLGDIAGYPLAEAVAGFYSVATVDDAVALLNALGELRDGATWKKTGTLGRVSEGEWRVGEAIVSAAANVIVNAAEGVVVVGNQIRVMLIAIDEDGAPDPSGVTVNTVNVYVNGVLDAAIGHTEEAMGTGRTDVVISSTGALGDGDRVEVRIGLTADGTEHDIISNWHVRAHVNTLATRVAAEVDATGTGATLVEVTVLDDSAVAVAAANVNIYASDGSPLGIYALTDVAGKVQFQLNDGDYLAGISAQSAFEPHVPQAFTVAPANIVAGKIPVALTFTRTASVPPADPALCRVKFNVMDASGVAAADVTISATPVSRAMTVPTKVLTLIAATATTDIAGYAELLLPRADAINSAGSKAYRITLRKDGSGVYDVVEKAIPNTGETTFDVVVNG